MAVFGHASDEIFQRGWLTSETVVQLKLSGEKGLNVWRKKHQAKEFFIKMTPVKANKSPMEDGVQSSYSDDSQSMDISATRDKWPSWPVLEVAVRP